MGPNAGITSCENVIPENAQEAIDEAKLLYQQESEA